MPAAAPRSTTSYELIWVGTAWRGVGDRDVVGEQDLGGRDREVLRREAPVVGDDDALGLLAPVDDVARHAVGAAADVLERVVVGDPRPPAVRAEHDRGWAPAPPRCSSSGSSPLRSRARAARRRSARSAAAPRRRAVGRRGAHASARAVARRRAGRRAPLDEQVVGAERDRLARPGHDPPARRAPSAASSAVQPPRSFQPTSIEPIDDAARLGRALHHRVVDRDRRGAARTRAASAISLCRRPDADEGEQRRVAVERGAGSPGAATGRCRRSRRRPACWASSAARAWFGFSSNRSSG